MTYANLPQVFELVRRQLLLHALLVEENSRLPIDLCFARPGTPDRGELATNLELHGLRGLVGVGQKALALAARHGAKLGWVIGAGLHQVINAVGDVLLLLLTGKAEKN